MVIQQWQASLIVIKSAQSWVRDRYHYSNWDGASNRLSIITGQLLIYVTPNNFCYLSVTNRRTLNPTNIQLLKKKNVYVWEISHSKCWWHFCRLTVLYFDIISRDLSACHDSTPDNKQGRQFCKLPGLNLSRYYLDFKSFGVAAPEEGEEQDVLSGFDILYII